MMLVFWDHFKISNTVRAISNFNIVLKLEIALTVLDILK
jgi:hypothetical protein